MGRNLSLLFYHEESYFFKLTSRVWEVLNVSNVPRCVRMCVRCDGVCQGESGVSGCVRVCVSCGRVCVNYVGVYQSVCRGESGVSGCVRV